MLEDAAGSTTSGSPSPASGGGYQSPSPQAPPAPSTTGPAQTGDADPLPEDIKDQAALVRTLRKYQDLEKAQRVRLAELETAAKEAAEAKLSEQEKLQRRLSALEAEKATRDRQTQERILTYEIKLQAAALNLVDPDAAVKLLDWSQVEYDADGAPTNLEGALRDLVKDKPYLVAPPTNGQGGAPITPASPTNPATRSAGAAGTRRYSQADLADRTFYNTHRDDIVRAYREGRIDP